MNTPLRNTHEEEGSRPWDQPIPVVPRTSRERWARIRQGMKPLAIVFLVLLLILVLLPLGMGMAMDCPIHATACSATIGLCAAILGTITLLLVSPLGFIRHRRLVLHDVLLVTTLDKPPRLP